MRRKPLETHPVSRHSLRVAYQLPDFPMKILRALGTGLFLLILSSLMPTVFSELSKTIITFLQSSQKALAAAGILASYASTISPALH